jgi:hypothetical protein
MTKIKMKASALQELHNLVAMEAKLKIGESKENFLYDYVLVAEDDRVRVQGFSNNIALVDVTYENVEVEREGNIVIQDTEKFSGIPNRFSLDDELTIEDHRPLDDKSDHIVIKRESPEKTFTMKSTDPDNIESFEGEGLIDRLTYVEEEDVYQGEDYTLDTVVEAQSDQLQEVVEDAETVEANSFPFDLEDDGTLQVEMGDKTTGKIHTTVPVKSARGEASSKYQYGIGGILNNLWGKIKLYYGEDKALIIRKKSLNFDVIYLIAPVVE